MLFNVDIGGNGIPHPYPRKGGGSFVKIRRRSCQAGSTASTEAQGRMPVVSISRSHKECSVWWKSDEVTDLLLTPSASAVLPLPSWGLFQLLSSRSVYLLPYDD